jgi:hypothetical protein
MRRTGYLPCAVGGDRKFPDCAPLHAGYACFPSNRLQAHAVQSRIKLWVGAPDLAWIGFINSYIHYTNLASSA